MFAFLFFVTWFPTGGYLYGIMPKDIAPLTSFLDGNLTPGRRAGIWKMVCNGCMLMVAVISTSKQTPRVCIECAGPGVDGQRRELSLAQGSFADSLQRVRDIVSGFSEAPSSALLA